MATPAYRQKMRTAGNGVMAPMQNASASVTLVMVIDTAASEYARPMRSSTARRRLLCLHAETMMNMSSIPTPGTKEK